MDKLRDDLERLRQLRQRLVHDYELTQQVGAPRPLTNIAELEPGRMPPAGSATPLQALIFYAFREAENEIHNIERRLNISD